MPLFAGIDDKFGQISCLSATVRQAEKNTFILSTDDSVSYVGLILSGSVQVIKEDFWGRQNILSQLGPAELFAESFSCAHTERIPVSVLAVEPTEIMLIDCRKIIKTCSSACVFHSQLISNMLEIIANKNIMLMHEQLSKRTTREKSLPISRRKRRGGKTTSTFRFQGRRWPLPLSRQGAMSSELSKMRAEAHRL